MEQDERLTGHYEPPTVTDLGTLSQITAGTDNQGTRDVPTDDSSGKT